MATVEFFYSLGSPSAELPLASSSSNPPFPYDQAEGAWADSPELWHPSFRLDSADLEIVGRQRSASSQLGLALQLGCVRHFGAFVGDLSTLPDLVRRRGLSKLAIADSTTVERWSGLLAVNHRFLLRRRLLRPLPREHW